MEIWNDPRHIERAWNARRSDDDQVEFEHNNVERWSDLQQVEINNVQRESSLQQQAGSDIEIMRPSTQRGSSSSSELAARHMISGSAELHKLKLQQRANKFESQQASPGAAATTAPTPTTQTTAPQIGSKSEE